MTNQWTDTLTDHELTQHFALTAKIDPAFAARSHKFWVSRSRAELVALWHQAWLTNDGEQYQLAKTYYARYREK